MRPGEFSQTLQVMWAETGIPDLKTPFARDIFCTMIEEDQGRTNPNAPEIDIEGGDGLFAPPLEFVYTDRLIYRDVGKPIRAEWHCNCFGNCADNPDCECRMYQEQRIQQMSQLGTVSAEFEGFAYTAYPKTKRHKDLKYQPTAKLKDTMLDNRFPIFECNGQVRSPPLPARLSLIRSYGSAVAVQSA